MTLPTSLRLFPGLLRGALRMVGWRHSLAQDAGDGPDGFHGP